MLDAFLPQLRAIEDRTKLPFWSDKQIIAGEVWDQAIQSAIDQARIFVLLISPHFIASTYIRNNELPAIQDRRDADPANISVVRVLLTPCDHDLIEAPNQAVPTHPLDGRLRAISKWGNRGDAYNHARQEIMHSMIRFNIIPATTKVG